MAEHFEWSIPESVRPKPGDYAFDLDEALLSVVSLRAEVPSDAFTASILGTERSGNGVVIGDDGLVLTIGYLITEAETVWLMGNTGTASPAHVVAYDQETGFGLVQALSRLPLPAMEFGSATDLAEGDRVIVAAHGGRAGAVAAHVAAKREFAGYWEYVLDQAIFTTPPHPNWGGTALIGEDGRLYGIGSLFVQQAEGEEVSSEGNMIVPIDILNPILDDLLRFGRTNRPPRPWLGMYATEAEERLIVAGLAEDGPAHRAGIEPGDFVIGVGGRPVEDLADMFRRVWGIGEAGVEVPLTVVRGGRLIEVRVRSADRNGFLKAPKLH